MLSRIIFDCFVARDHPAILIFGLALSIVLMGVGATVVVRALDRYHWIGYAGLAVILYVALSMIWAGAPDLNMTLS